MISGISNNYSTCLQQAQLMQHKPGPEGLFKALDEDGSGGIDQTELDTWAANMSTETGKTTDTTDAVSTYDTDGDGALSSSELKSFLDTSGIKGPDGPPPGPPPESVSSTADTNSASSVVSSYDTNGDGVLSTSELQSYLDDTAQTSSASDSSILSQAISAYVNGVGQSSSSASALSSLSLTIDIAA